MVTCNSVQYNDENNPECTIPQSTQRRIFHELPIRYSETTFLGKKEIIENIIQLAMTVGLCARFPDVSDIQMCQIYTFFRVFFF